MVICVRLESVDHSSYDPTMGQRSGRESESESKRESRTVVPGLPRNKVATLPKPDCSVNTLKSVSASDQASITEFVIASPVVIQFRQRMEGREGRE
jgi:hypothetical protein